MGVGRSIGSGFIFARDKIARGLIVIGVSPNSLTVTGFGFTFAAGVFLALGAGDKLHGRGLWASFLGRYDGPEIGLSCVAAPDSRRRGLPAATVAALLVALARRRSACGAPQGRGAPATARRA